MTTPILTLGVRNAGSGAAIIDIRGEVTATSGEPLTAAYDEATATGATALMLNFTGLEYMNSSGIGMLVTLLVRANRQRQRLSAFGLTEHYRQIFELTRLDEAIAIYDDEVAALSSLPIA